MPALLTAPEIRRLKRLDLHHHFCSPEMVEQLKDLGIDVDTSDPRVRAQFTKRVNADRDFRRHLLRRLAIDEIPIRTDQEIIEPLLKFFRARETRTRR